jgi:hypothetical protein
MRRLVASLGMALVTYGCSSSTEVSISSENYLHQGETLKYAGGGCQHLKLPSSGGAKPGQHIGDFNMQEGPDGDTFLVRVFSDDELLATRRYDEPMLQSGKVDEFTVTTHLGSTYTLRYWGGPCSNPPNDLGASSL